jgi:restriction system protein
MAIPKYHELMLPILKLFGDGKEHHRKEFDEILAKQFKLTDDELQIQIKSGQSQFISRVIWSMAFLKQGFLIEPVRRGYYLITSRGREILSKNLESIDGEMLMKLYPDLLEKKFWNSDLRDKSKPNTEVLQIDQTHSDATPEEIIDSSYWKLRELLKADLIEQVKKSSPVFFEKLVVDLLVAMGYGGSIEDAGSTTRLSNDEGIDGVIKEDILGLGNIYLQAKRYTEKSVGRPEIQAFVGALAGKKAKKGVFITTSTFASGATDYAKNIEYSIVLIDGEKLTDYMIDFGIGVSIKQTIEIKRLDTDYFDEE